MSDRYYKSKGQGHSVKFTSYLESIEKDLAKSELRLLKKAASYVAKKMREKAKSLFPQRTGHLVKGIGYKQPENHSTLVGVGPPAQHAHLLEFGTKNRTIRNRGLFQIASDVASRKAILKGKKKGAERKISAGKVTPKPFILPTLMQEESQVREILSERWA